MSERSPAWPAFEWETATPADEGLDPLAIGSVAQILGGPGSNAAAFMVVRRGRIVWEQYYDNAHSQDRHHLFSITKSVVSALIGIALRDRLLESVDQPLADFFPEVSLPLDSQVGLLTVRHLLTMTTGLTWPRGSWGREPLVERMRLSPDWVEFILGLPVRRADIGIFHYASASSHLLSAILTRVTGMSACDFANRVLFGPLGIPPVINGADWDSDPRGNSLGGWGLHLAARELARFGWLYVCDGQWQGQSLLPPNWVSASTQAQDGASAVYGYQWWLRQVAGERVFAGLGVGGQFLFCVPRREMVVVILSRFVRRWPDRWELLRRIISSQ